MFSTIKLLCAMKRSMREESKWCESDRLPTHRDYSNLDQSFLKVDSKQKIVMMVTDSKTVTNK